MWIWLFLLWLLVLAVIMQVIGYCQEALRPQTRRVFRKCHLLLIYTVSPLYHMKSQSLKEITDGRAFSCCYCYCCFYCTSATFPFVVVAAVGAVIGFCCSVVKQKVQNTQVL